MKYLLIGGNQVSEDMGGIIDEELVEVVVSEECLEISDEVVIETHGVNNGIEAFAISVIVELETSSQTHQECSGFSWVKGDSTIRLFTITS